ncbi:sulfotransferase family protein [Roseovarius sp. D22-M7]|uniref:sulfotransferase family protein n=1 Tax=Roseovarius sp. D22-M7 TaxID=3127116 RepID=UPI003010457E
MSQLDEPIILFCSERSGSNMIAKIFDAHPEVSAPGDSHLFAVMSECACRYRPDSDDLRCAVLELFDAKVSEWVIDTRIDVDRVALLSDLTHAGEMAAALYAAEARAAGKPHVMTKENSAFRYLPMLMAQSTRPRILFMTRDPRDMALSWRNGPVMRGGVLRATDRWCHDQQGSLETLAQLGPETPVATLRYEDVLSDPEGQLRRVCRHLDLPFCDDMLRFSEHSSSARTDAKRSSMWSNLDKPILSGNAQKFRRELDDDQIAYIEAATAPLMAAFGYATARPGRPEFGRFDTLDALRDHLAISEPHDKPAYRALPAEERARFEGWSQLVARMLARPPLPPAMRALEAA